MQEGQKKNYDQSQCRKGSGSRSSRWSGMRRDILASCRTLMKRRKNNWVTLSSIQSTPNMESRKISRSVEISGTRERMESGALAIKSSLTAEREGHTRRKCLTSSVAPNQSLHIDTPRTEIPCLIRK